VSPRAQTASLLAASLLVSLGTLELLFRKLDFPFFDGCFVLQNEFWREDPELGFGYVMNRMQLEAEPDPRAYGLVKALYGCLD